MSSLRIAFILKLQEKLDAVLNRRTLISDQGWRVYNDISNVMEGHELSSLSSKIGRAQHRLMMELEKLKSLSILLGRLEKYISNSSLEAAQKMLDQIDVYINNYYTEEEVQIYIRVARRKVRREVLIFRRNLPVSKQGLEDDIKILESEIKISSGTLETLSKEESNTLLTIMRLSTSPTKRDRKTLENELDRIGKKKFEIENQLVVMKADLAATKGQSINSSVTIQKALRDLKMLLQNEKTEERSRKRLFEQKPLESPDSFSPTQRKKMKIMDKTTMNRFYKAEHQGHLLEDQYTLLTMNKLLKGSFAAGEDIEAVTMIDWMISIMANIETLETEAKHDMDVMQKLQNRGLTLILKIVNFNLQLNQLNSNLKASKEEKKMKVVAEIKNKMKPLFAERDILIKAFSQLYPAGFKQLRLMTVELGFHGQMSFQEIETGLRTGRNKTTILQKFYAFTDGFLLDLKGIIAQQVNKVYVDLLGLISIYVSSYRKVDDDQLIKIITKLAEVLYASKITVYNKKDLNRLQQWMKKGNEIRVQRENLSMIAHRRGPFAMLNFIMTQIDFYGMMPARYAIVLTESTQINMNTLIGVALEFNRHFKDVNLNLLMPTGDDHGFSIDKLNLLWKFISHMVNHEQRLHDATNTSYFMGPIEDLIIQWTLSMDFVLRNKGVPYKTIMSSDFLTRTTVYGLEPKGRKYMNTHKWEIFLRYFIRSHISHMVRTESRLNENKTDYTTYYPNIIRMLREAAFKITGGSLTELGPLSGNLPANQRQVKKFKNRLMAVIALGFLNVGYLSARELFVTMTDIWEVIGFLPEHEAEFSDWVKTRIQNLSKWIIRIMDDRHKEENRSLISNLEKKLKKNKIDMKEKIKERSMIRRLLNMFSELKILREQQTVTQGWGNEFNVLSNLIKTLTNRINDEVIEYNRFRLRKLKIQRDDELASDTSKITYKINILEFEIQIEEFKQQQHKIKTGGLDQEIQQLVEEVKSLSHQLKTSVVEHNLLKLGEYTDKLEKRIRQSKITVSLKRRIKNLTQEIEGFKKIGLVFFEGTHPKEFDTTFSAESKDLKHKIKEKKEKLKTLNELNLELKEKGLDQTLIRLTGGIAFWHNGLRSMLIGYNRTLLKELKRKLARQRRQTQGTRSVEREIEILTETIKTQLENPTILTTKYTMYKAFDLNLKSLTRSTKEQREIKASSQRANQPDPDIDVLYSKLGDSFKSIDSIREAKRSMEFELLEAVQFTGENVWLKKALQAEQIRGYDGEFVTFQNKHKVRLVAILNWKSTSSSLVPSGGEPKIEILSESEPEDSTSGSEEDDYPPLRKSELEEEEEEEPSSSSSSSEDSSSSSSSEDSSSSSSSEEEPSSSSSEESSSSSEEEPSLQVPIVSDPEAEAMVIQNWKVAFTMVLVDDWDDLSEFLYEIDPKDRLKVLEYTDDDGHDILWWAMHHVSGDSHDGLRRMKERLTSSLSSSSESSSSSSSSESSSSSSSSESSSSSSSASDDSPDEGQPDSSEDDDPMTIDGRLTRNIENLRNKLRQIALTGSPSKHGVL